VPEKPNRYLKSVELPSYPKNKFDYGIELVNGNGFELVNEIVIDW
jgi:hypothetical protein